MIIIEELEKELLERGWYLHFSEIINGLEGRSYFRCRIRFPCRGPLDCSVINTEDASSEYIIDKVDKHLTLR